MLGRRGVAEIIAAMLLIIITVAAALLLYGYASGLMGRLQGGAASQPYLEQVSLDYYNWPATDKCNTSYILCLTLRNVGVAKVTIAEVFVNGVLQTPTLTNIGSGTGCNTPAGNVPLNTACMETIASFAANTFPTDTPNTAPTSGVAYQVKIVTNDGAILSYSCIAGQAA
ncbi:MAG: archaellin/type IV pilin N-terminal domain-containing protein [Candidatus Bathyarchaeia archaeon]